jgi:hypothetical protein
LSHILSSPPPRILLPIFSLSFSFSSSLIFLSLLFSSLPLIFHFLLLSTYSSFNLFSSFPSIIRPLPVFLSSSLLYLLRNGGDVDEERKTKRIKRRFKK